MNWRVLCLAAVLCVPLAAQDSRPKFEVASVKECGRADKPGPSTNSPDRLSLDCWPMWRLLIGAYEMYVNGQLNPLNPGLPQTQIDGGRELLNNRFSIDAKADGPASVPMTMMLGPMMQTLLEDRFHLKWHREYREIPVYLMTVARGGAKLHATPEGVCQRYDPTVFDQPAMPPGDKPWCGVPTRTPTAGPLTVFDVHGMTVEAYAQFIRVDRLVVDHTGLTGTFDIHVEWLADEHVPGDPPGTALRAAIRKQLGLELEPAKAPYEYFVIDHIERPSEN